MITQIQFIFDVPANRFVVLAVRITRDLLVREHLESLDFLRCPLHLAGPIAYRLRIRSIDRDPRFLSAEPAQSAAIRTSSPPILSNRHWQ
jgi:hypothetical protein